MLREVEEVGAEAAAVGPRRDVERLRELDAALEVEPAALVDGEQGGAVVLLVVRDHHAHEQLQADHEAHEDEGVDEEGVAGAHLLDDHVAHLQK